MKNLYKLALPALLFSPWIALASCQTPSQPSSSAISQTAEEVEAAICADLQPQPITSYQFNTAPQWARDYLVAAAAVWQARCNG